MFDDGDRKSKVDAKLIKSLENESEKDEEKDKSVAVTQTVKMIDKDDGSISKGDRVEAKLKGWTKYYKVK